jgi:hypothetical protein
MSKIVKTVQGESTFMAFPPEKQAQMEQVAQRRRSPTPAPMARPVPDAQRPQGPQHAVRPPVQVHAPAGQQIPNEGFGWLGNQSPVAPPQPVAAVMNNQPMAHPVSYQAPAQVAAAPMMEPQLGTVKNTMPGFENAVADGESMSLALPSRFAYYGFRDCYIQPFRARHLAKLQKAHREQSLLPIVEAVSAVMSTTEPSYAGRPLAFDLSLPDFYMALYWLRMNSFTKSNYMHKTRCTNPEHIAQVDAGQVPADTLQISQVITKSQLEVIELERIPDPDIYHFSDTSAMIFRPPTMRDVVEFSEAPELQDEEQREEFTYLAQLATHIQHRDLQLSLAQRVEIVKDATADQVELIQAFEKELGDFGVLDKVEVQCKHCGHSQKTKLNIAAHSFFQ